MSAIGQADDVMLAASSVDSLKLLAMLTESYCASYRVKLVQCTAQRLQRLHQNTPRAGVFLLAGCLPGEDVLHQRQLGLFSMICHIHGDPLHSQVYTFFSSSLSQVMVPTDL